MSKSKKIFIPALQLIVLVSAILVPGALRSSEELPFTADELARLDRGEVVLRHVEKELSEEEVSSLLISAIWVPHPQEVIWEVLNHPEREMEWLPHLKQSKVVSDTCPTPSTRTNTTDYRIRLFGIEVYYSLVRVYDHEKRTIKAHMDKTRPHRFFQDIQAGWDLFPHKGGTIFQYWSDSKLVVELPTFVSEALAERTLIVGVTAIAKRCDQIAQEMKQKPAEPVCPAP